jgi:hypothetical protein
VADPITLTTPLAVVEVPPFTTFEGHDAEGNLICKFDVPRPYKKTAKFVVPQEHLPLTVTFTEHSSDPVHTDEDPDHPVEG